MKLVYTTAAEADLDAIATWGAERWGRDSAIDFVRKMDRHLQRLVQHPEMGRQVPEFAKGLRCWRVLGYLAYYQATDRGPRIIAILHERQNQAAIDFAARLSDL